MHAPPAAPELHPRLLPCPPTAPSLVPSCLPRRLNPRQQLGSNLAVLFQGHPMVLTHMVPTLLRLYVDVEFTDQHNAFYMKFNLRQRIAEVGARTGDRLPSRGAAGGPMRGARVAFYQCLLPAQLFLSIVSVNEEFCFDTFLHLPVLVQVLHYLWKQPAHK